MLSSKSDKCDNSNRDGSTNAESTNLRHEHFLSGFEKPTQIYRYLRANTKTPLFLNRCLNYRPKTARSTPRKEFSFDEFVQKSHSEKSVVKGANVAKWINLFTVVTPVSGHKKLSGELKLEAWIQKMYLKDKETLQVISEKATVTLKPKKANGDISSSSEELVGVASVSTAILQGEDPDEDYLTAVHTRMRFYVEQSSLNGHNHISSSNATSDELHLLREQPKVTESMLGSVCFFSRGQRSAPEGFRRVPLIKDPSQKEIGPSYSLPSTIGVTVEWSLMSAKRHASLKRTCKVLKNSRTVVLYSFSSANSTDVITRTKKALFCQWCLRKHLNIYCLLKHYRLCHARFLFTATSVGENTYQIHVTPNEFYDGSYEGNLHDLSMHVDYGFGKSGPSPRVETTQVLVHRAHLFKPSMAEFATPEVEASSVAAGHKRIYYHPETTQSIRPWEFKEKQIEEIPDWLFKKTCQQMDDFTDLNPGEKELMKLWNVHTMKNRFIADRQLHHACQTFVEANWESIKRLQIRNNVVLHFMNLHDFGMLTSEIILQLVTRMDTLISEKIAV